MPAQEVSAPWENDSATTGTGSATAEAETKPDSTTNDDASKTDGQSDPDYEAFMRTQGGKDDDSQPDDGEAESQSKTEAKDQDTKPDESQPVKIEFTPKASKYAKELGVTEEEALDVALKAFDRVGVLTDDEIEGKFKKDAKAFIEQGLKLAKTQKETDRAFNAFQRGQQEPQIQQAKQEQAPEELLPLPEAVKKVIDSALEPIKNSPVYEDLNEPLGIAFTTIADQLSKHYGEQLRQAQGQYEASSQVMQQQIQALNGYMVDAQLEKARNSLVEEYPSISDPKVNDRVLKMYDTLISSGGHDFKSPEEAYRKAVSAELGEESKHDLKKRLLTQHQNKKQGQPKVPKHGVDGDRKMTPEELDQLAFARAMKKNGRTV
jgi:hypothetical protein